MTSLSASQLTLNFEPTIIDKHPSLRDFIAYRSIVVEKSQKMQAADMDMSPSLLTRKLNPKDEDTQRFNCDDLEKWLVSTNDAPAVIEYLAAKYMDSPEARRERAVSKIESTLGEVVAALAALKGATA